MDIIIEYAQGIVLIERKNPPHGWALPGGFVDYGESVESAARREALEETGLTLTELRQFHVYSDPRRDPRMHTVTTVFVAKGEGLLKGADDALRAVVCEAEMLPSEMAFDHRDIVRDYVEWRRGVRPPWDQDSSD